jgi:hypothetical protein
MIIAIVVVAVLVVGGGLTVWLLTRSDGDSDNANQPTTGQTTGDQPTKETSTGGSNPAGGGEEALKSVAQSYFEAVNKRDESAATKLTCKKDGPGVLYEALPEDVKVEFDRADMASDVSATVFYKLQGDTSNGVASPIFMAFEDGAWCVST